MTEERHGDWNQTFLGKKFWCLDPRPEEVFLEDIAHSLSNMCRFAGHVNDFYSVSQHSVLVSENVPPEDALWGLLHDASEAYLVDVPRPLKIQPEMSLYREAEARLMVAICQRFGLPIEEPESVKIADKRMVTTEKRDLLVDGPGRWKNVTTPYEFVIEPWLPEKAKAVFLKRYAELNGPTFT